MLLTVQHKKYNLKFGLKELMELEDFLNNNSEVEDIKYFKFYLAIRNNHLSEEQIKEIYHQISDVDEKIDKALEESIGTSDDSSKQSIKDQIEDLYKIAVGEIGISPHFFYEMTPHEIELAYKGYLDKKILEANLITLALKKVKSGGLLNLYGDGVTESTLEKRDETFSILHFERTDE